MDPRLLQFYTQELAHVRDVGAEFAERFPKIASRLAMDSTEVQDPYVERLLEGFAFLSARVQLRMHEEFPRFTEQLLNRISPNFLAPVPSMGVIQFNPNLHDAALKKGLEVPAGTVLQSQVAKGVQTPCKFTVGHGVTLLPIEIAQVSHGAFNAGQTSQRGAGVLRSALTIRLGTVNNLPWAGLSLDSLDFYVSCGDEYAFNLFERIAHQTKSIMVRESGQTHWTTIPSELPQALGFDDSQALLPVAGGQFSGNRLLQEFFSFPQRFLFFRIKGLARFIATSHQSVIEIALCFNDIDPTLDRVVDTESLALNCTPVVNLFEHDCDRVLLDDRHHEAHVQPNRVHPLDFEVHSILAVQGHGQQLSIEVPALYASAALALGVDQPCYSARRTPTLMSDRQRAEGGRSSYLGSEVYLGLTQPTGELSSRHGLQQLAVRARCSNRDLPLLMPLGQGTTDLHWSGNLPLKSVRFLRGPSRPKMPIRTGQSCWQLIEHLSLNYLGLMDTGHDSQGATALSQLLTLHADPAQPDHLHIARAIQGVSSHPVVQRILCQGRPAVVRGVQVNLLVDELALQGVSLAALGGVLARYLSAHVSVNSFVQTRVQGLHHGRVLMFPAMLGSRPLM